MKILYGVVGEGMGHATRSRLVLEPAPPSSLLALLATLKPLDEELPRVADAPPADDVEL